MSEDFRAGILPQFTTEKLAALYQVDPRQIRRWKAAGLPYMSPLRMRDILAVQNRTGRAGKMLMEPGAAERLDKEFEDLIFSP